MEILRGGQKVELVGNPPEVGDQLPKFKVFTAKGAKVKTVVIKRGAWFEYASLQHSNKGL